MGRSAATLSAEFEAADLGDERLNRRLVSLADRVADRPGESFPKMLDDAELEAAYRFFGNDQVTPEAILAPHFRQSARRAAGAERVIVVHDTTAFEFGGQTRREGLGHLIKPSVRMARAGHLDCSQSRRSFGSRSESDTTDGRVTRA